MRKLLLLLAVATASTAASAHQFKVLNKGKIIYYNIVSEGNLTAEVTYSGNSYDVVANEYAESIVIPEKVTQMGKTYSVIGISKDAFRNCSRVRSVTIPESVKTIGEGAFKGCSGLQTIKLPNGINEINESVFEDCTTMLSVNLPDSLEKIADKAFKGCSSLTALSLPATMNDFDIHSVDGCKDLTSIAVDTLCNIYSSEGGVLYNKNMTRLMRCPEGRASVSIPESVREISTYAFYGCYKMTGINIPASIGYLGDFSFVNCTALTEISFPESIKLIPEGAFKDCTALKKVSLSNATSVVRNNAFYGCTVLAEVSFPAIVEIGEKAFYNCSALKEITFPATLKTLNSECFGGCISLISIKAMGAAPAKCDGSVFDPRSTYKCALSVPEGKVQAYRAAAGWKGIYNIK